MGKQQSWDEIVSFQQFQLQMFFSHYADRNLITLQREREGRSVCVTKDMAENSTFLMLVGNESNEKLWMVLSILSILNILSISLNLMLLSAQICEHSYDLSIRIYSLNLALSYLCTNGAQLIKSIFIWATFANLNHSQMIDGHDCLMQELPIISGYLVSTYTVAFIAIDRLIATRKCQNVKTSLLVRLSVAFAILSWPFGTLVYMGNFMFPLANQQLPVCLSIFAGNKVFVTVALAANSIMNVAVAVGYRKLVSANKVLLKEFRDSQLHINLAGRLQLRKNVIIAECLWPSVLTSACLWLLAEVYVIFSMYLGDLSTSTIPAVSVGYCNHLIGSIHSVVHPIVVISRSPILRRNLYGNISKLNFWVDVTNLWSICKSEAPKEPGDLEQRSPDRVNMYFDELNRSWTASYANKQRSTSGPL